MEEEQTVRVYLTAVTRPATDLVGMGSVLCFYYGVRAPTDTVGGYFPLGVPTLPVGVGFSAFPGRTTPGGDCCRRAPCGLESQESTLRAHQVQGQGFDIQQIRFITLARPLASCLHWASREPPFPHL